MVPTTALFIVIVILKSTEGSTTIFSPYFDDPWDFKIAPNDDPLIKHQISHGEQLSLTKREGKKSRIAEEDLQFIETQFESTRTSKSLGNTFRELIPCSVCKLGVGILQGDVKKGRTFKKIKEKFVSICVAFKIQTQGVCSGLFEVYGHDVLPVFNFTQIGSQEICSMALGESCGEVANPLHEWNIQLPENPKPDVKELPEPNFEKPFLKVLQISDTHFDPEYTEGSPANCIEPLCCRSYSTPMKKVSQPAGRWGSYGKCDSPLAIIENMFENLALNHPDIDYIIWTGDLPPHDIWNQTKSHILENLQQHVKLMKEYFPNTPIFPALGNHEAVPAGSFAPPWVHNQEYSIRWLYDEIQEQWKHWLPESSNVTIHQGGFYSVLIRPGFRLISLNTNYCGSLSWWLMLNSTDPAKELKWLVYELQMAEDKGEKVHIIGHIPPGYADCLKEWSRNFNKIVNRYESTITAQFYGHTHGDEFQIFYDDDDERPTNVAYLGPSVTTFGNFNPAFRIYYIDGEHDKSTWEVLDHETWTTDLEGANKDGNKPHWYKLYSARDAYNMKSLRPKEWNDLIQKMINDSSLFGQFYKYYYRDSKARPFCDATCQLQALCDLKSGRSHDRKRLCSDVERQLKTKFSI